MRFKSPLVQLRPGRLRQSSDFRAEHFHARLEQLEVRQMLAGQDLLVATYDDTAGKTVLRYNDVSYTPAAGSVATGDNGLNTAQGIAVAPDGSFYVSSADLMSFTGSVYHYDVSGNYLGKLGENDASPATIVVPGTLAFGPNGHLYLADLGAQTIYEFDTSSTTQQFVGARFLGYAPGAMAFAVDGSDDLLVGSLDTQSVTAYHTDNTSSPLIAPGSGYNFGSIVPFANGDMLLSDFAFSQEPPTTHHQIVKYTASSSSTSPFINLTFPVGTGSSAGDPPQPTGLLLDHDGNLLVALSPDHNLNGAVQKYNVNTGAYMSTLVSNIGAPTAIAFTTSVSSAVADRQLFYRNSSKWNVTNGATFSDDNAIAPDKTAYLPGSGTSAFSAVSSYSRGINGVMVDINGPHGTITSADFAFKVGNNNSPNTWATAPAPIAVTTRAGAGKGGSDRIELTWNDNDISSTWLEIIVKGNDSLGGSNSNTGLTASDVFFFGSAPGDSGAGDAGAFQVTSADEINARNNPKTIGNPATITDVNDFDRDGLVNSADQVFARNHTTSLANQLKFLVVGAGGPFAPSASSRTSADVGLASALASSTSGALATANQSEPNSQTVPASNADRTTPAPSDTKCEHEEPSIAWRRPHIDELVGEVDLDDVLSECALANLGLT